MQVKCLEVRDDGTFCPVICIKPVPDNDAQRWLLRRDGYSCKPDERLVIYIAPQCQKCAYDPYEWTNARTHKVAHHYIEQHWHELVDGDVVDVEYILGEKPTPKLSERIRSSSNE